MGEIQTFTVSTRSLPVSDEGDAAMMTCWRTSNLPFTHSVLLRRETVNALIAEITRLARALDKVVKR